MSEDLKIIDKKLERVSNKKRTDTKGITIHSYAEWYDMKAQYDGFNAIQVKNEKTEDYGFNYLLDEYDIVEAIDTDNMADPFGKDKPTYIDTNLYQDKAAENTVSVCIFISKDHDYTKTEEKLIKLLAQLCTKYKLKSDNIWRGFDISKEDKGPLQYLDKEKFKALLKQVDDYMAFKNDPANADKEFDFTETQSNDDVNDLYSKNKDNVDSFLDNYEPWDKDKKEIKEAKQKAETTSGLKSKTYPTKNKLQYKITSIPPGSADHCVRAADKLDGIETEEQTMVEPIYPDLITPPGGQINIANGKSDTSVQSQVTSTTAITVEDFEKRQQVFNIKNFSDIKKDTIGRPVNTDDPFPVDEQIKKLEEHFPKVKIDKTTFDFTEDNHPGSVIGRAMAKNYAMTYDMINEVSKRTEKRLVKLENNLATVMRNVFRMSSRININCQYYGGQSVYGKYKCIRCMHDNRLDDGAVVTLDQCLCCTRYEPILGQVYAILDDAGSNVSRIVDDIQSAYMDLADYQTFNNINEYASEPKAATLLKDSNILPKEFRESKWKDTTDERKAKQEAKAKKAAADAASGNIPETAKKDESILFTYDELKDYLDIKLEEVIILNGDEHHQVTREEYIVINKQELLPIITAKINAEEDKPYKNSQGNDISREDYIKDLTKRIKDSYYNDDYYNGFKMDWNPTVLETHKPSINEYNVEKLKDGKANLIGNNDHQGGFERDIFIDSRDNAIKYEQLEFNIKDYDFSDFGEGVVGNSSAGSTKSGTLGGMTGSEARKKIVEYAQKQFDLCAQGKAYYNQDYRLLHDEKALNGINYFDCSSLVEAAYEYAGITGVSGNTATEYPPCLDTYGGLLIPISQVDKAMPGDMIWFYDGDKPDDQAGLQNIDYNSKLLRHVGIYIGNNKYIHASGQNSVPNIKTSEVGYDKSALAFGRPKDLIDLDKIASQGVSGGGALSKDALGIPDEYWNDSFVTNIDADIQATVDAMNSNGYKQDIIDISKENGFDPYLTLAMICVESTGNPNCVSTHYNGLMQVDGGSFVPSENISKGLSMLMDRKGALINAGWNENNIPVLLAAHNFGQGSVINAAKDAGISLGNCTVQQLGDACYAYAGKIGNDPREKKLFPTKVIRAYCQFYDSKVLG